MPDFKKIVQERIASLHLEAAAESSLTEEFAQHLEDRYQELRADGATEHEAYREALSELDDLYPLCTELPTAGSDAVPAGDVSRSHFIGDLSRDSTPNAARYRYQFPLPEHVS